jgi:hypothetical protein
MNFRSLTLMEFMRSPTLLVRMRGRTIARTYAPDLVVGTNAQPKLLMLLVRVRGISLLVSVHARHYLLVRMRGFTLLVRMRTAQPYLAGALPSPEDELAEVRVSQVSLLPGQDSCTKSGHTTTTFKTTLFHVRVVVPGTKDPLWGLGTK